MVRRKALLNQKLTPLVALQKIDLRIMEVTDSRKKIPDRLQAAEVPLREAVQALQQATAQMENLVKERRSHEKDLDAHEAQTEKLKARLSEIKTNKEYQAHLFEIELANKKRGDFEEKILLCMEHIDELQRRVKELQAQVAAREAAFAREKTALEEQDRALVAELAQLEAERGEAAAGVDRALLDRYNQIKAARKDQALAAVRGGICAGCRLQIPPQLIAQVKRSEDLHMCPYCRRMLYWEGEPIAESAPASGPNPGDLETGESV